MCPNLRESIPKFAITPQSNHDAHRRDIPTANELKLIFAQQHQRKLSKQLELSYNNVIYQIQTRTPSYAMRKATVTVCDYRGNIAILYKGKPLAYTIFDKNNAPTQPISDKTVNVTVNKLVSKMKYKPPLSHPWRKQVNA